MNDWTMVAEEAGQYRVERAHPDLRDGDEIDVELIGWSSEETLNLDTGESQHSYKTYDTSGNIKLPVTKLIDEKPLGFENYYGTLSFVSEDYYQRDRLDVDDDTFQLFAANIDDVKPIIAYLDEVEASGRFERIFYDDVKETQAQSRRIYLLISIFLYGFVAVVTLIGVTNIFNTITTNIALRAKEFAMLRSVGMTDREFKRMVRLESLMYVSKALIIGLPIGLLLSYGIYKSLAEAMDFGYIFPWSAVIISIVAVSILIGIIMRYSVKQVEKQNIIETIRDENI